MGQNEKGGFEREKIEAEQDSDADTDTDTVALKVWIFIYFFLKGRVGSGHLLPRGLCRTTRWSYGCWQCYLFGTWLASKLNSPQQFTLTVDSHTPRKNFAQASTIHVSRSFDSVVDRIDVHIWLNMITHYVSASTGITLSFTTHQ